jgi:hypothetical protein
MNPEMEKELETEIGKALQGLPDLAAPPGFLARTMGALEQPAPWRMRPWAGWPLSARIAFLVFALAAVAGFFAEGRAIEPGLLAGAWHRVAPVAVGVACFWNVLCGLTGALALAVQHLGKGFMLACLAAAAGACAFCAGFGTIFVRLALTRPGKNQL